MAETQIPWWWTDLGQDEIDGVVKAIRGRHISRGTLCAALEAELARVLDVPHVDLTMSGSSALLLALLASGVGHGDEVIVPAMTYIATAHAPLLAGARVRLVDVQPDRPLMDPAQIEAAITKRTRAIIPVHLNGCACDMTRINEIAARNGIAVIEDCAQAFTSRAGGQCLGAQDNLGTFSMSLAKLITTGEGGFVAVRDEAMHVRLTKLRNQGVIAVADNVFDEFGFNLRFNDLQASVGLAQVGKLQAKIDAVKRVYQFYCRELAGLHYLRMLDVHVDDGEVPLWSQMICADRDTVCARLAEHGIQTRAFNPCLADSPHLKCRGEFPQARFFARHGLTLPSGPDQPAEHLERTVAALRELAGEIPTRIDMLLEGRHA